MSKIKLLIVEDNGLMQKVLRKVIDTHFPEIEIVGVTGFVTTAIDLIETEVPDLLLMDIHLNDGTAFDILKPIDTSSFKVIFISAYQEFMLESLKFSSVDFIFKPFDINDIVLAVDKAINELKDNIHPGSNALKMDALIANIASDDNSKQLVLLGREEVKTVSHRNILWGKAKLGYSKFHFTNQNPFLSISPLRHYEALLNTKGFYRCQRHYLVNTLHINYVDPISQLVHLKNGDTIPLDHQKYDPLMALIQKGKVLK